MMTPIEIARAGVDLWNRSALNEFRRHECTFAMLPRNGSLDSRFAFISLGSDVEALPFREFDVCDVVGTPVSLSRSELYDRLMDGHVGCVLAPASAPSGHDVLPSVFQQTRDRLRLRQASVRMAIRQIGLEQLSLPRGASPALRDVVASAWGSELGILLDIAMELTAGADRQRYVDPLYRDRIRWTRTSAIELLSNVGVRSNSILTL